ncbi:MAG: aminoacyl-tRNA deacylase [Gammaproteobacteria bacterium]
MAIAQTIADFLVNACVDYHVYPHQYAESAIDSARLTKLKPETVAKAVVIATKSHHKRTYCLVVIPADRAVNLHDFREVAFQDVELASESELAVLFPDCEVGAVPALGEAYGLPTFIDETIISRGEEIFFEAGDHQELIRIDAEQLERLMPYAELVSVSKKPTIQ